MISFINRIFCIILNRLPLVVFIVLSICLMYLHYKQSDFYIYSRNIAMSAITPILKESATVIDNVTGIITHIKEFSIAKEENKKLKEKIEVLEHHSKLYKEISNENVQLRKLLKFVPEFNAVLVSGRALNSPNNIITKSIIISVGRLSGIEKGHIVVNQDGVVGRVIEVNEKTSRVLLITDIDSKIPFITLESRNRAIAAGMNKDDTLEVLYLSDNAKVKIGEMVITSGDGEIYPSGLIIGTIQLDKKNNFYVSPSINLSKLDYISVLNY